MMITETKKQFVEDLILLKKIQKFGKGHLHSEL